MKKYLPTTGQKQNAGKESAFLGQLAQQIFYL